jgi:hypothetical protein
MCRELICLASSFHASNYRKGEPQILRCETFRRKHFIVAIALAMTLFVCPKSALPAQELRVGFITGRGDDAAVEEQAFAVAEIEYEKIEEGDYTLNRLLEFDVIGVGVVAYDSNPDLKANYSVVKEYIEKGGYLVTLDFQQDSTWNSDYLPHPLTLLDPDLEDDVGVILADHDIFKIPNTITEAHFGAGIWGAGDFAADAPEEVSPPWEPLVTDQQNNWPIVVGAPAGKGYVVFSSLQTLQSLGRLGNAEVAEVLQNFLFWRGPRGSRVKAYSPSPKDGALHIDTWVSLSWSPGTSAVSHDVYVGDDLDTVEEATRDSDVFRGNQTSTFYVAGFPGYAYPDGLVPGATYYWRIDEVNDADPNSPWKGDVWSFSIPPKTAYDPEPADGTEFVDPDNVILSWTPGFGAKLHTVYLGDDYDEVSNATVGVPVGPANYNPGPLEREKAYYWRVDEFDGIGTYKGDLWSFTTPGAVGNPKPAYEATDVGMNVILGWTPADSAASHQLYFGTDKEAVRTAGPGSPEDKGSIGLSTESYDPGLLDADTTYYWRVDELDTQGNTLKGPVWIFTTGAFLLVDDFEGYTDDDAAGEAVWQHWIDGFGIADNGAQAGYLVPPYCEQTIVHGGAQSMPLVYTNEGGVTNSEAALTLTTLRDWTQAGVAELSLWFRGASDNAQEPLYVAVSNSTIAPAILAHEDPSAGTIRSWTQWRIPLQAFVDQGLDLTNLEKIAIGLGSKSGMVATGGSGTIYIDDIRLYQP